MILKKILETAVRNVLRKIKVFIVHAVNRRVFVYNIYERLKG